ncbi:hydrogenase maturation factor HypF (carbamoyltransferase family) [Peribacillus sp. V2I11]|nr:hydrogenase maturation factor HypF (carbamoyltransferase family) [Peribacillus sp. V2I11]
MERKPIGRKLSEIIKVPDCYSLILQSTFPFRAGKLTNSKNDILLKNPLSILGKGFNFPKTNIEEVIIGGGGSYNKTLLNMIQSLLGNSIQVLTQEE